METKVFKLEKSGYTAEMATYLSSKVAREHNKMVSSTSVLKMLDENGNSKPTVEVREMPVGLIAEAQDYVLEKITIRVLDEENMVKTFADLINLPATDVDPLYDYTDQLIKESGMNDAEKKDGLEAASSSKREYAASTKTT